MIDSFRKKLNKLLPLAQMAEWEVAKEQAELVTSRQLTQDVAEARALIQGVAEAAQSKAHAQICSVVDRCLETVFPDDPYTFKILFEQKRGRTEARLCFERDGKQIDPMTASGGGAVDVASFALRLVCLILSTPKKRKALFLDEPFKFLSKEFRPAIRELIKALSDELDIQFVMVTHSPDLVTGDVIRIVGD